MKKTAVCMGTLVLALMSAAGARAQFDIQSLNATMRGQGTLERSGERDTDLSRVQVVLLRGGDARIRAYGRRGEDYSLTGRWFGGRSDNVDLRIDRGFGSRRMEARGMVNLRSRGGFDRIELSGRTGSERFTLRFRGESQEGGDSGSGGNYETLRWSGDGRGRLLVAGRNDQRLQRIRVDLRANGDAEIVFYSEGSDTFRGRQLRRSGDDITLQLEGRFGSVPSTVVGTLNLRRRGGIDRVNLRGTADGRRVTIDFDSDD